MSELVSALTAWFGQNARDLPWRRTHEAYPIWISEIMLQQTQVKTVIPYWERWMGQLPGIAALASARPEKVLKLWEGLGYYTRARNLQKAAQLIVTRHCGQFPQDFQQVLNLPGIGRYTAGAICSIAFNQPAPILDGNVIRVLTRLFGIDGNPRQTSTNAQLWKLAADLVSEAASNTALGDWKCSHLNQALMELGALVCTSTQPKCPLCPIRAHCLAHETAKVEMLPNLDKRVGSTPRRFAAFLLENDGRVLVRQRAAGVVNAHLWEFPNVEVTAKAAPLRQIARKLLNTTPLDLKPLCVVKHTITRYRITVDAYHGIVKRRPLKMDSRSKWLTWKQLEPLPFTSAHGKILACAKAAGSELQSR